VEVANAVPLSTLGSEAVGLVVNMETRIRSKTRLHFKDMTWISNSGGATLLTAAEFSELP
jgi:hypothetical protein